MSCITDFPKQPGSKQKQKQQQKTKCCWTTDLYLLVFVKNWQAIRKYPRTFCVCIATA